MNILIVDDREENRLQLERVLVGSGHTAKLATNGAVALDLLQTGTFDMVISDILMPLLDGYELCRRIRATERFNRLGFIVYTATYTGSQDEAFALGLGADRFVSRPCEPVRLLRLISEVHSARRQVNEPTPRHTAVQESSVLKLYNERLVKNLEDKMQLLEQEAEARRQAEASLQRNEEELRQVFESIRDGIVVADLEGRINKVNRAFCLQFRVKAQEALGQDISRLSGDADRPWNLDASETRTGSPGMRLITLRRWDGSTFPGEAQSCFLRDDEGVIIGLVGLVHDVTERQRQAEELRRTRAFLDTVINAMPVALFCKDNAERRYRLWNHAAEEMIGLKAAQVIGRCDHELFTKAQADSLRAKDDQTIASGQLVDVAAEPFTLPDGSLRYRHTRNVTVNGPNGQQGWLLGVSEDITERRAAAEQLRSAHAEAEEILSILSAILIGLDCQGRIVRFNETAERVLGRRASDVRGLLLQDCGVGLDWDAILPLISATLADGVSRLRHEVRCKRGDAGDVFLDLNVIRARPLARECQYSAILVGYDTTHVRQMETQRAQGQKLEAVGHLAAGIAHEVNTPIQFIGDNLKFLGDSHRDLAAVIAVVQARLANGAETDRELAQLADRVDLAYLAEQVPRAISQSLEGVSRVTEIVRALKEFAHPDAGMQQPVDINHCLLTTLTVACNEYKYAAEVVTRLEPDLPTVPGMAGQLGQVFLNLVVNAAHSISEQTRASGGRGTITISTQQLADMVEIRIADTGTGIRPEHRQRLFTPFFTTKPVGQGSGQGLALCHAVVVGHHGGSIDCESEYGHGCTFIIRLPLRASGSDAQRPASV